MSIETNTYIDPSELTTKLPGVLVRDISPESLPDLKKLFEENFEHFSKGGVPTDYMLYEAVEKEVNSGQKGVYRIMGIWKGNEMAGFVDLEPVKDIAANEYVNPQVEVSFGVSPKYARQGIAKAAVEAVVQREIDNGNDVIARVNLKNNSSANLLARLEFDMDHIDLHDARRVFARKALTDEEMFRRIGM
jgi:GNAT superfamily N-acetyltransferase